MKALRKFRIWCKFFWSRLSLAWDIAWKEDFPCVFVYCPNCGSYHVRQYDKYEDEDTMTGVVRCDGGYVCEECGAKATFSEKWSLKSARCRSCSRWDGENQFSGDPDCFGEALESMSALEKQKQTDLKRHEEEKFAESVHATCGYDPCSHGCPEPDLDADSESNEYAPDMEDKPEVDVDDALLDKASKGL